MPTACRLPQTLAPLRMAESAFVVFVPEAEPLVGDLRLKHDPAAVAGISAHVTVLFPFMEPARLEAEVLSRCAAVFSAHRAFRFELRTVGRFPATAYLEPEPPEPFVALTHAVWAAYPAFPPFGGEFASVVTHLTVANGNAAAAARVAGLLRERLGLVQPLVSQCRSVSLIENSSGKWRCMHEFSLASEPGS